MATAGGMWALLTSCYILKTEATRVDHDQAVGAVWSASTLVDCLLKFINDVRNLMQQTAAADNKLLFFGVSDKVRLKPVSLATENC